MIVATMIRDIEVGLARAAFFVLGLNMFVEEGFALFLGLGAEQPRRGRSEAGMGVEHREALFELLGLRSASNFTDGRCFRSDNQVPKPVPQRPRNPSLDSRALLSGSLAGGEKGRFGGARRFRRSFMLVARSALGRAKGSIGLFFLSIHAVRLRMQVPVPECAARNRQGRPL